MKVYQLKVKDCSCCPNQCELHQEAKYGWYGYSRVTAVSVKCRITKRFHSIEESPYPMECPLKEEEE